MKKRFTRFMALLMTAVLCMSTAVFAVDTNTYDDPQTAKGSASSEAKMEGWVNKDIFKVVLPTVAVDDTTFGFIIDPQGLIAATSGEAYQAEHYDISEVTGPGLYFKNISASSNALSTSSDTLTALNKGTSPVKVSVSAKVTGLNKIGLSETSGALTSADAKKPNIYLAIAASGNGVVTGENDEVAVKATGGKADYSLAGASADAYEIKYVSGNASGDPYTYELKDSAVSADATSGLFESVSFYLTGACNTDADVDWSAAKSEKPAVEVAWTLTKDGNVIEVAKGNAAVTVTTNAAVSSIKATKYKGEASTISLSVGKHYTVSGTQLTLTSALMAAMNVTGDSEFTLTLSDGTTQTLTVK